MVAALLQLHDNVDEASDASLHSFAQSLIVLGQYPSTKQDKSLSTGGGSLIL